MVTVSEAFALLHRHVSPVGTEIVPLEAAIGRTAAEQLFARFDLPRFDNSAMDGYAVTMADAGGIVRIAETVLAGDDSSALVRKGEAVRIMTGAVLPDGADAVIPLEETQKLEEGVRMPDSIRRGAHIRQRGEDVARGERILDPGDTVSAYTVSLLASQGVTHLRLFRRPRVAVFATGQELKMHYEKVEAHQIYNSNAPMFVARARELGCEARFTGAAADSKEAILRQIESALDADLIVTSGGVSVGDADFTLEAFETLGMERLFHKVDIKPGKPTTVGRIGRTWIINLPGNPAAAAANFELFARTLINRLAGRPPYTVAMRIPLRGETRIKPGRPTVLLGRYDGETFEVLPKQGPGMVRPFASADGLILTDGRIGHLSDGYPVRMIPLGWNPTAREAVELFTT